MIKKKRYGGLILFLAIFLALRPASALAVHAAETDRIPEQRTEAAQLVSEERFVPARIVPARPVSVKSDSVKADPVRSAYVIPVSENAVSVSTVPERIVPERIVPERIDPFGKIKEKAFRDPPEQGGLMRPSGHDNSDEEKTSKKKSKKNFEIPQFIKDYHFDADAEKKKLAEAISKLDELGFSPEKMAERLWDIISRRENREKIGKAAEDLKENTGKLIEKASGAGTDTGSGNEGSGKETSDKDDSGKETSDKGDSGKDTSDTDGSRQDKSQKEGSGTEGSETDESQKEKSQKEESPKEESQKEESQKEESGKNDSGDSGSGKDSSVKVRKSEDTPLYERAAGGVDRVKEKVREEASKKVDEAIDKAAEAAADYAVKEINETAEKVKEEVR